MRTSRSAQLAEAAGVRHFHLSSGVAGGLPALASAEMRTYAGKLLERLCRAYAIRLEGFAFTADHFHLVVQWMPEAAEGWSSDELARRWRIAQPPPPQNPAGVRERIEGEMPSQAGNWAGGMAGGTFEGMPGDMDGGMPGPMMPGMSGDPNTTAMLRPVSPHARRLLGSLSAFLQRFKQLLTFHANRAAGRTGTIWQGRFKLAPLPDNSAVAGAMAFVDLLPVARGEGTQPEQAPFTSLHARVVLFKAKFGMSPYGPLGEPDGAWQPLPAEVTAELRDETRANDYEAMEPPEYGGLAWVVGLQGDAPAVKNGVGLGFTLRRYLGLLDQLVQKAKTWPHLPAGAPGRALPNPAPAWEEAVEQALRGLGLAPEGFEAQWRRLAGLRG